MCKTIISGDFEPLRKVFSMISDDICPENRVDIHRDRNIYGNFFLCTPQGIPFPLLWYPEVKNVIEIGFRNDKITQK